LLFIYFRKRLKRITFENDDFGFSQQNY